MDGVSEVESNQGPLLLAGNGHDAKFANMVDYPCLGIISLRADGRHCSDIPIPQDTYAYQESFLS
jgi:hypothetical protein